jgi:hypothetical protein
VASTSKQSKTSKLLLLACYIAQIISLQIFWT